MMAIPKHFRDKIDPEYALGLGGLKEDAARGLQCPIKGCGVYRHSLARHLRAAHEIEPEAFRDALSLPRSTGLLSTVARERISAAQREIASRRKRTPGAAHASATLKRKWGKMRKNMGLAVGVRNLRGSCAAQLGEKLKALASEAGKLDLTRQDMIDMGEQALLRRLERVYGTFNKAKAAVSLPVRFRVARRLTREIVEQQWRAFRAAHGRFPSASEAQNGRMSPMIPSYTATARLYHGKPWWLIVREIAAALDSHPGVRVN
jgi:hypothetical protein